jgi:para-nitrobenzyl esterase
VRPVGRLWLPLFVLCCVRLAPAQSPSDSGLLVAIDSGVLEGVPFGPARDEVMFLGIPYAAPPTGDRRWKPPQPVEKWHGTRKANRYGGDCFEAEDPHADDLTKEMVHTVDPYFTYRHDEDCLYLNVWTTKVPEDHSGGKLPVMVWIHGSDQPAQFLPAGPTLARMGVVFVSTNYRVGALGFMAHPALTAESPYHASGNYGILDLIAALEWTQRNISKFSGDPTKVTIFGESSDGMMVCFLMSSPLARGLFQQAIVESLGCADTISPELKTSSHYEGGVGTAEEIGLRLIRDLGIADGPDALTKLRAKGPKEITAVPDHDSSVNFDIESVIDGWVLPEQPATIFAQGRQAKVRVIVGSNADEGTTVVEETLHGPPTLANYKAFLKSEFVNDAVADEIFRMYPASSDADSRAAFIAFDTDYEFGNSVHVIAKDTAGVGQKAWLYYFSYPARSKFYEGSARFTASNSSFSAGGFIPATGANLTLKTRNSSI